MTRRINIEVTGCLVDCPFSEYMSVNCGRDYFYCNHPDKEDSHICYNRKEDVAVIKEKVFPDDCPLKEEHGEENYGRNINL